LKTNHLATLDFGAKKTKAHVIRSVVLVDFFGVGQVAGAVDAHGADVDRERVVAALLTATGPAEIANLLRPIYTIRQIVSCDTIFTDRINPIFCRTTSHIFSNTC
jgi:hypothetical protein